MVALHPEGVDRNVNFSEPVRKGNKVALHPEGVDRNTQTEETKMKRFEGRPPPGGRG